MSELKLVLDRYCAVSGQAVNSDKSAVLFSANTPENVKDEVLAVIGVPENARLGNYLGIPTEWGSSKVESFRYMLERLELRAQSWRSSLLSHAGRETMIKAILQALPSYLFSCFMLPKTLIKKMNAIVIKFWWNGDMKANPIHWVKADILRTERELGGLGLRHFEDINLAFMEKLAWRVLTQPEAMWVKVLKGLYFPAKDFLSVKGHYRPSWIWSSICKGREALLKGIRRNVGNGHSTFLDEAWLPEMDGFRYSIEPTDNCKISECILMPQRCWNTRKLRSIFAEEVVKQILRIPLGPEEYEDRWIWHFEPRGHFSIKSCYRLLNNQRNLGTVSSNGGNSDFWKWLWGLSLPRNMKFFMWRLCVNAIATKSNLLRRHCRVNAECSCCLEHTESAEHLFLRCRVFIGLWGMLLPNLMLPDDGVSCVVWLKRISNSSEVGQIVEISFILWNIWKFRNKKAFQNEELSMRQMEVKIRSDMNNWIRAKNVAPTVTPSSNCTIPRSTLLPTNFQKKVVCDGAFNRAIQRGGLGVIMYDSGGRVVDGRVRSFFFVEHLFVRRRWHYLRRWSWQRSMEKER
ncbi:Putative ribonuclease H protein At1g65750 [Linum perenne]